MTSKSRLERRREMLHEKARASHVVAEQKPAQKAGLKHKIIDVYSKEWKKLMLIPTIILILSLGVLFYSFFSTGQFIDKGVSIKGGISITISSKALLADDVKTYLEGQFPEASFETRTLSSGGGQVGIIIEASDVEVQSLEKAVQEKYGVKSGEYTVEVTGSSLGASFYRQMILGIIAAFILMGIVVYVYFRTLVPSAAIILAAFSDMITTLAVINLLGVKITAAGIAAFLMLIGYSVDTDVLLTARVLKRKEGTTDEKIFSAIKTGTTMTIAAIAATGISLILTQSETIQQIMLILVIGLFADLVYTWIQNVGLLKWYLERKGQL